MLPFRELEIFDSFMLDGRECEKIGQSKYLTYDALGEPRSLDSAEPNMMVELVDDEAEMEFEEALDDEDNFFYTLLDLLYGLENQFEKAGQKLTIESLRQFAKDFLWMPKDP